MAHIEPSNSNLSASNEDGCADALATVAIITLVVATVAFWLHGMPM